MLDPQTLTGGRTSVLALHRLGWAQGKSPSQMHAEVAQESMTGSRGAIKRSQQVPRVSFRLVQRHYAVSGSARQGPVSCAFLHRWASSVLPACLNKKPTHEQVPWWVCLFPKAQPLGWKTWRSFWISKDLHHWDVPINYFLSLLWHWLESWPSHRVSCSEKSTNTTANLYVRLIDCLRYFFSSLESVGTIYVSPDLLGIFETYSGLSI